MTTYSKSLILASADNTKLVDVSISSYVHEHWIFEDGTEGKHTVEGGLFSTYELKSCKDTKKSYDTVSESEAAVFTLIEFMGYREVTQDEATKIMENTEPELPAMPEGMIPGTYAYTAWLMASTGMMSGDEADAWKDQMKDGD